MVAITVRALILAFAFGICIADDDMKMPECKCKIGGEEGKRVYEEITKNFTACLETVKPGADLEKAHKDPNYLTPAEKEAVFVCVNMKAGIISEDRVYLVDVIIEGINMMDETEQEIKDSLIAGINTCAEGKDAAEDCVEIMNCVHTLIMEVCYGSKQSDEAE